MTSRFKIDEKALLLQFQSGNKLAFDQIFRLYKPSLTFFGNKILLNYSQIDSQELVLDIFMKLYEKRASFESLQSIKAFLYISTKNICLNAIEKEKVRLKRIDTYLHNFDEAEDNVLNKIVQTEVYQELYQALELLPEQCRIIMLQLFEGKTAKEISEELSISVSTINSQKARAISILRKHIPGAGIALLLLYF
ncbi:hypothetical protein BBI01_01250 [Chryseobacterium artocarpi]|uniref:HTH luxR-type domain-containing protein n=1 Tax=Chryseobacterium artocarpi TaxID=1414727 RepID=A0A1B8ZZU0_9FLAO|nr:sigma-70 family RNA polymerase sigma factor [Chryseobacterium artocarpi]OCA77118.1 hypothetical protein BBI01_01250 [Chryseobacterium artocarpi]